MSAIADLFRAGLGGAPAPAEDDEAFVQSCKATFRRDADLMWWAGLVFMLLWWPTDAWVYRASPEAREIIGACRVGICVLLVVYRALIRLIDPRVVFTGVSVVSMLAMGWVNGHLGSPEQPYLHVTLPLVLITLPLPVGLGPRLALNLLFAAALLGGYFSYRADYLASNMVPYGLSLALFFALISALVGHAGFLLRRQNFMQARKLEAHSHELEDKVKERTVELRRLVSKLETTREDERSRISRELHDELGQQLTALRYALAYVRTRYETEPDAVGPNLVELDKLLGQTRQTIRGLLQAMRPLVLDDMGLCAALEWLVKRTGEHSGVRCELKVQGSDSEVGPERAAAAFRVAQESLTNIIKHARAQSARLELGIGDGQLLLKVTDDGAGFEPGRVESGLGLIGMRERAESLGGAMHVESRLGSGTVVSLELPLPQAPPLAA